MSLLLASAVVFRPLWESDSLQLHHPLKQFLVTGSLGLSWHLCFVASAVYRSYRMLGYRSQLAALARGTTLASICTAVWLCVIQWNSTTTAKWLLIETLAFWGCAFTSLSLSRVGARLWTHFLRRRGRNLRNILIVGSNHRAIALADRMVQNPSLGYRIAGFVDDSWYDHSAPEHYKQLHLGGSEDFLDILRAHPIDEVIVALPIASFYQLTQQIISWCLQQGICVRSEGTLFDVNRLAQRKHNDSQQLITLYEVTYSEWDVTCKRLVDLFVSASILILTSPLMIAIAIIIRMTSDGPALFSQERLGGNKRSFKILKFRTMVTNAEAMMTQVEHLNESAGPTFKFRNDPRITPIGAFLRKTSLDELPQFLNVFRGEMSLVGPRPLPLRDYRGFSADWHRRRFSVKPGITCLWQISGRSSITFDRWMELDMEYIDRWSVWLDFEILFKTIPAVLRGSGAM